MKTTSPFKVIKLTQVPASIPFDIKPLYPNDETNQPHIHDHFELIWILNGSGTCSIDLRQYNIKNNQVFCIRPGQMHQFCPKEDTEGFIILFSEAFLNIGEIELDLSCHTSLFQLFLKFNGAVINDEIVADLKEIVYKMRKEIDNLYLYKTEILKRYFKIFLIYLSRQFEDYLQTVIQTRNSELVQNFMKLLDINFKEKKWCQIMQRVYA